MNQKFIGGIGNIYASEILYAARINPHSISCNLTTKSISKLLYSIKRVLNKAIKLGGSSISNYYGVTSKLDIFRLILWFIREQIKNAKVVVARSVKK